MTQLTVPQANLIDLLFWLVKKRKRLRVMGVSMEPTLKDGEEVLVDLQAYRNAQPQVGDIVWAKHPFRTDITIVKRITAIKNGRFFLSSDNPDLRHGQTDSRHYGMVSLTAINGRICCRLTD